MKKLATAIAAIALIGTPAFAADMAVKAPPPPAPISYSWTGFYGGIQFGGGWSDEAVNNNLGNDPAAMELFSGAFFGMPPIPTSFRVSQSGPVGGFEAGYNWQVVPNWVLGLETDFSGSGISGTGSRTSILCCVPPATQTTTATQDTDWYGTVRGRIGWLATPNLLLFGTGGFAYGRVDGSANYSTVAGPYTFGLFVPPIFGFACTGPGVCFAGSSSAIRTGWTAGGGLEWLLDQHWSAKIEYQFVDLGTETVRVTAVTLFGGAGPGTIASSFNAAFRDQFNVVRLGLNYRF